MSKDEAIFSGDGSEPLWDDINRVFGKRGRKKLRRQVWRALYAMGCRCQELETRVEELKKRKDGDA